jgi:hypothetical protein
LADETAVILAGPVAGAGTAPMEAETPGKEVFKLAAADLKISGDELDRLRDKYPAWHIWMSQARRLWATRKGRVSLCPGRDSRWSMTIDADTFQDLDRKLEEQILLG